MMVTISPIAPAIPAATAIQDPAARRFAQAVSDAISAMQSSEGSVRTLTKAAEALSGAAAGGVPPGIAQWLFSSELYAKLSSEIVRVDLAAKQQTIAEALARQEAISAIQATLADIGSTAAYDPGTTYAIGDMVTFDGKLYRAKVATTGNLPTDTAFWEKVGDYATLSDVVAAHTLSINDHESRIDATEAGLSAETSERASLAAQVRGGYSGTDANAVTQGLIYSERIARASADSTEVAARQSLSAKLTGATDPTGLTLGTLASGLVFDEKTARVSAVGAVATSVSALEGRTSATEGAILTEQSVRAGNDNALVSAINTMWAITGATTAISTSGSNLVTSWTSGQANYWNTLNAEVFTTGGQTIRAALSQEATVRATQTGELYGQYTVKIDTNGYVAGFGLASSSSTAGVGTSSFVIRADKFAMVMPGYGNYVPFAIGAGGVEFNGNVAWSGVTDTPGMGANLLTNSELENNAEGWTFYSSTNANDPSRNTGAVVQDQPWAPPGRPLFLLYQVTKDGGHDPFGEYFSPPVAVSAGERVEFSAYVSTDNAVMYVFLAFYNQAGSVISYAGFNGVAGPGGSTLASYVQNAQFATAPPLTTHCRMFLRKGDSISPAAQSAATALMPYIGRATASQTQPTPYGPGPKTLSTLGFTGDTNATNGAEVGTNLTIPGVGTPSSVVSNLTKITTSTVVTYIDNAAIQNAQIGGNIWSSNYVAGSAGWIIDRTGYAEFRNILARGNIEATSIKADAVDVVSTLNIQGEAVTVPRHYVTAASMSIGTSFATVQSGYCDPGTGKVSVIFSCVFVSQIDIQILNPSGSVVHTTTISGNPASASSAVACCVASGAGTYTVQCRLSGSSGTTVVAARSLLLLGSKR